MGFNARFSLPDHRIIVRRKKDLICKISQHCLEFLPALGQAQKVLRLRALKGFPKKQQQTNKQKTAYVRALQAVVFIFRISKEGRILSVASAGLSLSKIAPRCKVVVPVCVCISIGRTTLQIFIFFNGRT